MEPTDFSNGKLWNIHPHILEEMLQKLPDPKTTMDLAVNFTETPQDRGDIQLIDNIAVIPIQGPISKRRTFFSYFFGGTPLNILTEIFKEALNNNTVQGILLDIDSPGGTVAGTEAFGDLIYNSRGQKPIVAFGNGMLASAAYWIGSGADQVIVERTAQVGSIGIVMVHYDWSKEDAMMGLKRTVLTAGKYKGLGNDAEPLSDLARKTFQAELDYIYTLFVDTVARNRGVGVETVLEDMADGRIFIGQQAVDAGLADSTGSFDTAIDAARTMIAGDSNIFSIQSNREANQMAEKKSKTTIETTEQLAAAYPDLVEKIRAEGKDSVDVEAIRSEAHEAGVSAERGRVIEILEADGDQAVALQAIKDGKAAAETFKLFYEDLKAKKSQQLETLEAEATTTQGQEAPAEPEGEDKRRADQIVSEKAIALAKEQNISVDVAMQQVLAQDPKLAKAYKALYATE